MFCETFRCEAAGRGEMKRVRAPTGTFSVARASAGRPLSGSSRMAIRRAALAAPCGAIWPNSPGWPRSAWIACVRRPIGNSRMRKTIAAPWGAAPFTGPKRKRTQGRAHGLSDRLRVRRVVLLALDEWRDAGRRDATTDLVARLADLAAGHSSHSISGANPTDPSAAGRTSLPSFARRRHSETRFACSPYLPATQRTVAPGSSVSATI